MPAPDQIDLAHGVPALHPERKGTLNISPRANWVEKAGGLPPYINSVATALMRSGHSRGAAIATAVNVVRKTCATGYWGGNPKIKISGAIKAAACAAAAQWEAKKGAARAMASERGDQRMIELANDDDRVGLLMIELADSKPYGDVPYADPGYQSDGVKRYPIDCKHVRAAASYISQQSNQGKYSADQLRRIKARIVSAARRCGVDTSLKA